eukprot:snap_masked-scaffold_39-processed-gene-2.58-mRNA-1 protein AED:1.00 eAED:1.00 QI:0/-1/0/0/-1/1/1/0/79
MNKLEDIEGRAVCTIQVENNVQQHSQGSSSPQELPPANKNETGLGRKVLRGIAAVLILGTYWFVIGFLTVMIIYAFQTM